MSETASPSRLDRVVRTAALLSCGPVFMLLSGRSYGLAHVLAGLVVSSSLMVAVAVPRRLTPRFGRAAGLFVSSLLLSVGGALIGAVDGCTGGPGCRETVGTWMLLWMLLPFSLSAFKVVLRAAFRLFVWVPSTAFRWVTGLYARLSRR
jgi:hypothetical protein